MKKAIGLMLISLQLITSCKKETVEPETTTWTAHIRYESTVKKLPVYLSFSCGSVNFQKRIEQRPSDAPFVFDTTVVLQQFDSIHYEMQYFPVNCDHHYVNNLFVLLDGKYRKITEIGVLTHYTSHLLVNGRVRCYSTNINSKHP